MFFLNFNSTLISFKVVQHYREWYLKGKKKHDKDTVLYEYMYNNWCCVVSSNTTYELYYNGIDFVLPLPMELFP